MRCAASDMIATELEMYPPTNSTTMKITQIIDTFKSLDIASSEKVDTS